MYYVMSKLRKETAFKSGKFKFEAVENKKLLSAIFIVYLALDEKDSFSGRTFHKRIIYLEQQRPPILMIGGRCYVHIV